MNTEPVKLSEVGGRLAICEWRCVSWAHCHGCGEVMYGPRDDAEQIYEDDPVVCGECGEVFAIGVEDGTDGDGQAWVREQTIARVLRPTALAGFRRLLRLDVRRAA